MSLMKTLAKVAIGVAVAKGASSMMKGAGQGRAGGRASGGGGGGLGDVLKQLTEGRGGAGSGTAYREAHSPGGGLQDMMGEILGGKAQGGSLGQGGLGGLLEQITGAAGGSGSTGGLQDILGGLAKGGGGAGGLGGLLGGLSGALAGRAQTSDRSFGEVLNSQFDQTPHDALAPSADQEAAAALMLRAMIQATKADGELDQAEQAKIVDQLGGDVDAEEARFVRAEMQKPLDLDGLISDTPRALTPQVYAVSVLGINLDSQAEAQYLHQLAQGFGLKPDAVNALHEQLGVQPLYS